MELARRQTFGTRQIFHLNVFAHALLHGAHGVDDVLIHRPRPFRLFAMPPRYSVCLDNATAPNNLAGWQPRVHMKIPPVLATSVQDESRAH